MKNRITKSSFKEGGGGEESIGLRPIGVIHSCYTEKFGIPRQSGMADKARARIELLAPYDRREMVSELDAFSHIWVQFLFHDAVNEGWKHTVRPPGLGGKRRVGVFASRSPHRPNHIGLSAVRLIDITWNNGVVLQVGGGDFLDGSPVLDIKPYIPYSDSICGAGSGFSGRECGTIQVVFVKDAESFCRRYEQETGRDLSGLISQVLRQDPRPASQRHKKKGFGFRLWDINIRWEVLGDVFTVVECCRVQDPL